jgi:hypothetical protein
VGQELIAYGIVALALGWLGWHFFRAALAIPLARWLLNRGQVKLAMRVKALAL